MIDSDEFLKFIFDREDYWREWYKPNFTEHMIHDVQEKYGDQGVTMYHEYMNADPNDLGNDPCPECTERAAAIAASMDTELEIMTVMSDDSLNDLCNDYFHVFVTGNVLEFDRIPEFMRSKNLDDSESKVKQFKIKLFLKYLQETKPM